MLKKILDAIAAASQLAGTAFPIAGLVGQLLPILNELVDGIVERSKGEKTRAEILDGIGIKADSELAILMASAARGE